MVLWSPPPFPPVPEGRERREVAVLGPALTFCRAGHQEGQRYPVRVCVCVHAIAHSCLCHSLTQEREKRGIRREEVGEERGRGVREEGRHPLFSKSIGHPAIPHTRTPPPSPHHHHHHHHPPFLPPHRTCLTPPLPIPFIFLTFRKNKQPRIRPPTRPVVISPLPYSLSPSTPPPSGASLCVFSQHRTERRGTPQAPPQNTVISLNFLPPPPPLSLRAEYAVFHGFLSIFPPLHLFLFLLTPPPRATFSHHPPPPLTSSLRRHTHTLSLSLLTLPAFCTASLSLLMMPLHIHDVSSIAFLSLAYSPRAHAHTHTYTHMLLSALTYTVDTGGSVSLSHTPPPPLFTHTHTMHVHTLEANPYASLLWAQQCCV